MPQGHAVNRQQVRLKKAAFRVVLVCGGLLIGLLAAECVLRVVGFSEPQIYIPDERIGTRLMPGFRGIWTREGRATIEMNRAGFRDLERSLKKPTGTFRIAVLGDSYVEALQVQRTQSFCAVLEQKLKNCLARTPGSVEVLSFGVSGFGTAQQLLLLKHVVWNYEPDMILLLMCPQNDLADNSPDLTHSVVRPFYSIQNGTLVLDDSFQTHPSYLYAKRKSTRFKVNLINRSRLLQLYSRFRHRPLKDQDPSSADLADRNLIENMCYFEPEKPSWREAWRLTERLVVEIHNETQRRNVPFYLLTGSNGIQVDPRRPVREQFAKQLGVSDLFYFERSMQDLANRQGISMIGLAQPLANQARKNGVFLHGFPNTTLGRGHWNAVGHRAAADLVAKRICQDGTSN